jgi:hypothetical protein
MRQLTPSTRDLERWLLRRGVGALMAGRSRCGHCHRTPLIGEHVHLYDGGRLLCALCARKRKEAPVAVERVRSAESGAAVRHVAHAAAA